MPQNIPTTVDEYIASFPTEIRARMESLRSVIRTAAPQAEEKISWGMATYVLQGNLVHFSGAKGHIGFHPAPSAVEAFRDELKDYPSSKGTIRLPHDKPLPLDAVRRIVLFRVAEQGAGAAKPQY